MNRVHWLPAVSFIKERHPLTYQPSKLADKRLSAVFRILAEIFPFKSSSKEKFLYDFLRKLKTVDFIYVLGQAFRDFTGGFLLLRIFSVAISVSPHVCFILDLILISMFLFLR